MPTKRNTAASLTEEEKRIVKALLAKGRRNQDIQALINSHRLNTINSARITGIKKDAKQAAATDEEVEFYELKKKSYDPGTGLNQYDDERLVRAREAMILAVQMYNSTALKFKTEIFTVLTNIAWTYLLHEYYDRKKVQIIESDWSLALSKMIERSDCPLSKEVRHNIRAMKVLRDKVEHMILGREDLRWSAYFQSSCLNFDKALCELFGSRLSLTAELSLALQFARMNIEQLSTTNNYVVPPHIAAIDAQLIEGMTEEQVSSTEFQFRVVYTLEAASKSQSNIKFSSSATGGEKVHNVLVKKVPSDDLYPHKPTSVVDLVRAKSGKSFTSNDHTKAWRFFKIRPKNKSSKPDMTDRLYCIYNAAHKDYTYSDQWVERLIEELNNDESLAKVRSIKL